MDTQTPGAGEDREQLFELRTYLAGAWDIARTMLDRATGSRGTFTGVVCFSETDDGGLRFHEEGTVQWNPAGGAPFTGPATREYVLRPSATRDTMDMFFADGRPFHRMGFAGQSSQDSHWCDPDTYTVSYIHSGPDEFRYRWDVQGPAKNLLLESVLRRVPPAGNSAQDAGSAAGNPRIVVSAVCVFDAGGRLLTVRKRGTDKFMHPGGKPEAGESPAQAASRELEEEVGIVVPPEDLQPSAGGWPRRPTKPTPRSKRRCSPPPAAGPRTRRPRLPKSAGWILVPASRTTWRPC